MTRAELVERVLAGWPQAEVTRLFRVSRATVAKWVRRFREGGSDALLDRSSRPLRSPRQTDQLQEATIRAARRMLAWGPHRSRVEVGIARSTVYAVLRRAGLHRLAIGSIAPHGRSFATSMPAPARWSTSTSRNSAASRRVGASASCPASRRPAVVLSAAPASVSTSSTWPWMTNSRYAYVEALPDERGPTAAAFLVRALAHFERQGIAVERILTDNGACYVSRIFTDTAAARNIRLKRTRPFRPQTNGKAEAFNKIMQAEWAYQRPYYSNDERLNVLPGFLAYYNHRRPHGGIGGATPASRL